jgi:glutamate 5-kinase
MGLVKAWESCFQRRGLHTAQVLLTHDDLADRRRYLNARSTLRALVGLGVVPVVNENDVVANDELRFGDNDTLAALVANLVEADRLLLLTDQEGLYRADPRAEPNAELVGHARAGDPALEAMAGGGGLLGRGGMQTKLRAARLAARSGATTVIANGRSPNILRRLHAGESVGTTLSSSQPPDAARKRWLAGQLQARGQLELDPGAVRVLREAGRSLLAVGVRAVRGNFQRGELVACVDADGREVARGLVNYSADEARRIQGQPSSAIESLLGYVDEEELIHRDNLVLV